MNHEKLSKTCGRCHDLLPLESFSKSNRGSSGRANYCKPCQSAYRKEWGLRNATKLVEYRKKPESINQRKEYWNRVKNEQGPKDNARRRQCSAKVLARKQRREWMLQPGNRVTCSARESIRYAILSGSSPKAETLVGCSVTQLKTHLQSKFRDGMCWENYGEWHVDHCVPCCRFDTSTDAGLKSAFHFTNLQPLWAKENRQKGILAHHGPVREWGSPEAPRTLEALIPHQADMLSASYGATK